MCSMKTDGAAKPDSLSNEEVGYGAIPAASGEVVLKKGPWTSVEDAMLIDFVKKNGEGNWNVVHKTTELLRCGKSCRLRWANHLRPELKKGTLTREEEHIIIQMHAKIGNKWARIASLLPGRTDNEIKNYWNTRTKRRQRAGLPLYPCGTVCSRGFNNHLLIQNTSELIHCNTQNSQVLPEVLYKTTEFGFHPRKTTIGPPPSYTPLFPDIHFSGILSQHLGPYAQEFLNQGESHIKRNLDSETRCCMYQDSLTGIVSKFEELPIDHSELMYGNLELGYPYDPDPGSKNPSFFARLNGDFSSSRPHIGSAKMELPSLQCPETNYSNWMSFSDSTTDYIEFQSPRIVSFLSDCVSSPKSNGLLEALVQESQAIGGGKKESSEKSSCSSAITLSDMVESTTVNFCTAEGEEISDQMSPFSQSAVSLLEEPALIADSADEFPHKAPSGSEEMMLEEQVPAAGKPEKHSSYLLDFSGPDALLESNWISGGSGRAKETSTMNDDFAALSGDDLHDEQECVPAGTLSMASVERHTVGPPIA